MHIRFRQAYVAESQRLVRIEADLFEHCHQGCHLDLAQRRLCRPGKGFFLFHVQQAQADVQVCVRVIAHIHAADKRLAGVKVQLFHLELAPLMHVDGILMQQHRCREPVHLPDDPVMRRIGDIHNDEVFRRGRAQGNLAGREILRRPVILAFRLMQDPFLAQVLQHLLRPLGIAEAVALFKGQLESSALEMAHQDIQVIGIEQRVLRALLQQVVRVVHDILVNRRG